MVVPQIQEAEEALHIPEEGVERPYLEVEEEFPVQVEEVLLPLGAEEHYSIKVPGSEQLTVAIAVPQ